jgi:hypothetical protein
MDTHQNTAEAATNPPTTRPSSGTGTARAGRSAVTNGKRLHVVRPGDTAWARRFRDVLAEIISDLGGACLLREAWTMPIGTFGLTVASVCRTRSPP